MRTRTETFHVAGTSYRADAIQTLGKENDDYNLTKKELIDAGLEDKAVYKYYFPLQNSLLLPETDNPHDPNAIKVIVGGVHIGYVKAGSCAHVRNLLNSDKVSSYGVDIKGGPYKRVYEDEDGKYQLDKVDSNFSATIRINVNDECVDASPKSVKETPDELKKKSIKWLVVGTILSLIIAVNTPIFLIAAAACIFMIIKRRI